MIVVDANVVSYYFINGEFTESAHRCLETDPEWISPSLIVYEFHHVLSKYLRQGVFTQEKAEEILDDAFSLLTEFTYLPRHSLLTELALKSGCSSYDCAYIALARERNLTLITADKKLLTAFPESTKALSEF